MAKKKLRVSILAAMLAAAIAGTSISVPLMSVSAASSSELQGEISELENQQESLKQQQEAAAKKLETLKAKEEKQLEYKQTLDAQMTALQEEINVINKKIKKLDKQITQLQAEIADDEVIITQTFTQLKERIRALYLAGEASELEILLNAKSMADLADKVEVMKSITSHDAELIDTLKRELSKVKDQKAEIEKDRKAVAKAKNELESKKKEVQVLVEESIAVIQSIREKEEETGSLAQQLEEEFNAQSDELKKIYKQYYAAKSAEEKAAAQAAADKVVTVDDDDYDPDYTPPETNDNTDTGNTDDNNNDYGGGSSVGNGQFIWPTPGTTIITSGVGPRWGTNHNGIDISGANCYGNPIVASDSGTVIVAVHEGWGGGYGLHVMIDHGNGYTTVYGHASSVLVNAGQTVSQGQTIAYIGSTGDSTGPHLHFEIRYNGSIVDPEQYVGA